ncbi:MAG: hypothetical protein QXU43_07115, partial [Thermoproteota archaeon]
PKTKNKTADARLTACGGTIMLKASPIKTPIAETRMKASIAPVKTIRVLEQDDRLIIATWVLSPSSARIISRRDASSGVRSIKTRIKNEVFKSEHETIGKVKTAYFTTCMGE